MEHSRLSEGAAALICYFETSAIVKLVLKEANAALTREFWESADISVTTTIAFPEARAAITAARRDHRLSDAEFAGAKDRLEEIFDAAVAMPVDWTLAQLAAECAEAFSLQGYDAVHVAAASTVANPELLVVTWDRAVAKAARDLGLTTTKV